MVRECYAAGNVTGNWRVGGLVGSNSGYGAISNCYYTGSVLGDWAGGLVGYNEDVISNCYAAASVSGDDSVGGLVGYDYSGSYTKCFWDSDINPDVNGIGNGTDPNVIGEPTMNMQTLSTFTDAGWDFVWESANGPNDIWAICEGVDYPKLTWQFVIGDFDSDDDVDLADFAMLAARWLETESSFFCGGIDLTGDDEVRMDDLGELTENWLAGI
jgi:hypothetical protein